MKQIVIPKFPDIINERPANMPYDEYRKKLKKQGEMLRRRLRGVWVWKSKCESAMIEPNQSAGYATQGTLVGQSPAVVIK